MNNPNLPDKKKGVTRVGSGDLLGVMGYLSDSFKPRKNNVLHLLVSLVAIIWLSSINLVACGLHQNIPCLIELNKALALEVHPESHGVLGQSLLGFVANKSKCLALLCPCNQWVNDWNECSLVSTDGRRSISLPVAVFSQKVTSDSNGQPTNNAGSDVAQNLTDICGHILSGIVGAITCLIATRLMTPNEKS